MREPKAYLFDMDHTLVNCDCDVIWKYFLIDKGLAPADVVEDVEKFFNDYNRGELNIEEFIKFQFKEFKGMSYAQLEELAEECFQIMIKPQIYPKVPALIQKVLDSGCPVSVLTSTNRIIATPLANHLGIPEVMATEIEVVDGICTGNMSGEYCSEYGKVLRAEAFCEKHNIELSDVVYYGDNYADRFVLDAVGFPRPVNCSHALKEYAREKGWSCDDLK